jgi:hypothetical protein
MASETDAYSNSFSNSLSRCSNKRNALSIGADVVMSTPAAFNVSSGNFEPPERRKLRYASTLPDWWASTRCESATAAEILSHIYKRKMHGRNAEYAGIPNRARRPAQVFSKITFEKPAILRPEDVERECVAAFFNGVGDFLKLSKHGLPEKRAPQIVDLPVDDVGAHLRIARRFEQMIGEVPR